jgi:uncharacterized LabA/DUF88 family protein
LKRVVAIVDGLNLFHALQEMAPGLENVNLHALCSRLVIRNREMLVGVTYFTAIATHLSNFEIEKQRNYLEALESSGVEVHLGRFARRERVCNICRAKSVGHEEKETDVSVATQILKMAFLQRASKVLLFSADTDLLPAIRTAREANPVLEIVLVSSPKYLRAAYARTVNSISGQIRLSTELISQYQFSKKNTKI